MITRFEEQTKDLTEHEKTFVEGFVVSLRKKIGKENAVKSSDIIAAYKAKGIKIEGARVRKIINYIRVRGFVPGLIATSKGYYVATSKKELQDYVKSLEERIKAIAQVKNKTVKFLNSLE